MKDDYKKLEYWMGGMDEKMTTLIQKVDKINGSTFALDKRLRKLEDLKNRALGMVAILSLTISVVWQLLKEKIFK